MSPGDTTLTIMEDGFGLPDMVGFGYLDILGLQLGFIGFGGMDILVGVLLGIMTTGGIIGGIGGGTGLLVGIMTATLDLKEELI